MVGSMVPMRQVDEQSPLLQAQQHKNPHPSNQRTTPQKDLSPRYQGKIFNPLFGQLIAVLAVGQNAASFTLEYGLHRQFPLFLMFHVYALLTIRYLFYNSNKINESELDTTYKLPLTLIQLRTPWWHYLLLSMLDVGSNYLTLLSLQHTSLTSATLLGSLTVPSTMVVCRFLLGKQYNLFHCLGVCLAVSGGLLTFWIDMDHFHTQHPHSIFGDLMAILAALLYGIGDSAGEFWSKNIDRKEYLGVLGLFGALITAGLCPLLEWDEMVKLFTDHENRRSVLVVMVIYIPLLVAYYVSSSLFLVTADATLLNISLQSSNLWAILFSVVVFREVPPICFYAALILVVLGIFVYEVLGNTSTYKTEEDEGAEDANSETC